MRLTLNYSVCTVTPAFSHPCDTNIFTQSQKKKHLLQLKIHNIRMKFFGNQKIFHLCIKEILTPN